MFVKICANSALTISLAFATACTSQPSDSSKATEKADENQSNYRVDTDKLRRSVTFQTIPADDPASLIISCEDGKPDHLAIKLDDEPDTPPPLAGVFGYFHFEHEPKLEIEMGFIPRAFWSPRDQGTEDEKVIISRFFQGDDLSFTLPKPYGTGKELTWSAPQGDAQHACLSEPPNAGDIHHTDH